MVVSSSYDSYRASTIYSDEKDHLCFVIVACNIRKYFAVKIIK